MEVSTSGRSTYEKALSDDTSLPLWHQPWWLEAASGGRWDALCLSADDRVVAALPYVCHKKGGLTVWWVPPLTKSLGPWLETSARKHVKRESQEMNLLTSMVNAVPKNVYYQQTWLPERQNWLPFYWNGFSQTTRYTYRLDLTQSEEELWAGLSDDTRNCVRKAVGRYSVAVEETRDLDEVARLLESTFARQSKRSPVHRGTLDAIYSAAEARKAITLWLACENDGKASAFACVVRDATRSYYLLGGADPELRASGAQTLVLWRAILGEIGHTKVFDFEGSMVASIERSFRSFGSTRTPLFLVSGSKSRNRRVLTEAALSVRGRVDGLRMVR